MPTLTALDNANSVLFWLFSFVTAFLFDDDWNCALWEDEFDMESLKVTAHPELCAGPHRILNRTIWLKEYIHQMKKHKTKMTTDLITILKNS